MFVQSLLSTLFVTLSSLVAFAMKDWIVKTFSYLLTLFPGDARLEIQQYSCRWTDNQYYIGLNWYFSQPHIVNAGRNLTLFRGGLMGSWDTMLPVKDTRCKFKTSIDVTFVYKERMEGIGNSAYLSKYIELYTKDGTPFRSPFRSPLRRRAHAAPLRRCAGELTRHPS